MDKKKYLYYFTNKDFANCPEKDIDLIIQLYKGHLNGACCFTTSHIRLSDLISKVTSKLTKRKDFIPSHVGNIFEFNNEIYLFDIKPPRATVTPLKEYLLNTKDEYVIVIPNFQGKFNKAKYLTHILRMINIKEFGQGKQLCGKYPYGYFSALQSGLSFLKWLPNIKIHCSEFCAILYKEQGLFDDESKKIVADNLSPVEVLDLLLKDDTILL